jgi:hypothetical protein
VPVSVTRVVPACPGEILALSVKQAGPPAASPLLIHFNGGDPAISTQPGEATTGFAQTVYATAPPGTTSASVVVSPLPGTEITQASLGTLARRCAGS